MSGVLSGLNWGFLVKTTEESSALHRYGEFEMRPEGAWSFALLGNDLPRLRQIELDKPVHLPVPLVLKNDHTGEESKGCLHLYIQRDVMAGLVIHAKYRDQYFFGFNRIIRKLAEDSVRGTLFNCGLGPLVHGGDKLGHWSAAMMAVRAE